MKSKIFDLMRSKIFDFREDEPHCLKWRCGNTEFEIIEWGEFDEQKMKEFREHVKACQNATMVFVPPTSNGFRFKKCKKCGSLHKTYQPAEWKDKYILMSDTADLMKRYEYWKDK